MIHSSEGPPRWGGAGGPIEMSFPGGNGIQANTPPQTNQAKVLRLVRPMRVLRVDVHISVRDGPTPIGRTRPLKLRHDDLDELIDHALRLEARRA
jgi:hypothetical protein